MQMSALEGVVEKLSLAREALDSTMQIALMAKVQSKSNIDDMTQLLSSSQWLPFSSCRADSVVTDAERNQAVRRLAVSTPPLSPALLHASPPHTGRPAAPHNVGATAPPLHAAVSSLRCWMPSARVRWPLPPRPTQPPPPLPPPRSS